MSSAALISVKSNLMEDYRLAAPPPIGEEYAVIFSTPDDPETIAIGPDGHVYDIYPDPSSGTGYSVVDLAFPRTAGHVAASTANGAVTVFAAGTDNSLWSLTYSSRPVTAAWQSIALPPGVASVFSLKAQPGPQLLMSAGFTVPVMGPATGLYLLSAGSWTGGPAPLFSQSAHCWCPATLAGGATGVFFVAQSVRWPYYSVCSASFSAGGLTTTPIATGNYTMVAAAPFPGGSLPFALAPAMASGVGGVFSISGLPQQITTNVSVAVFSASADASGIGEIVAIATDGLLYRTRQDAPGGAWSQFVPIGAQPDQTFLALKTVLDPDGDMRIVAVTTENALFHIWQDPDTSDWYFDQIEYSVPGNIQHITSYRTQITFYDNNNAPAANADVQIFSDQPVTMQINGVMAGLNPQTPWSGAADGSGRLVLSYLTGSVSVGALSVWSSFMDAGDRVALDPSGPTQATLAALAPDGSSLMNARVYSADGSSVPLFSGSQAEAANISQAVLQAMTLASGASASPAAAKYLHRNNDRRVARTFAVAGGLQPGQIDFAAVPAQNWQVNFGAGGPVFENVSPEVAAQRRQARASLPRIQGFLGFDCDWGDVMDMVIDGTASLVEFAVDKLADGIHAAITITINAVNVVFDAIIGWVRQALDLIERVFQAIGNGFEQLFGWLGYLFNWSDILFMKDGIKSLLSVGFTVLSDAIQYLQQYISAWLENFNSTIDVFFQNIISQLGVNQNVLGVQAAEPAVPVDAEELNSRNVVLTAFADNAANAPIPPGGSSTAALGDPINNLIAAIEAAGASYQEGGANYNNFQQAAGYFAKMASQLTTQPDLALQNGIAGFLQTLNALAQAAISTVNTLITVVLDALAALVEAIGGLLTAAWEIPFVADLYSYITNGGVLSALDLGALILAIPVTIAYKLVSSDPLPDFTTFTAAKIEAMLGIDVAPKPEDILALEARPAVAADAWDPPTVGQLKGAWLICWLSTGVYAGINYKVDTTPVAGPQPSAPSASEVAFAFFNIVTELTIYITGAPCWSLTAPTAMAVAEWALGGFGLSLDMGTFRNGFKIQELNGDLGVCLTTACGVIYLVGSIVYWATEGNGVLDMPHIANLVATMPEWAKILRLSAIATPLPYGPVALSALGVIDVVCNVLPATFVLGYNWATLPTQPQAALAGA